MGLCADFLYFCPAFGRKCSFCSFGKDEVPSSNLGSSSTKSLEPQRFEGFLLFVFGGVIPGFVTDLLPGQMREIQRKTEKKKE